MITASVICTVYGITALIVACIVLKLEKPFWLFLRVPYLTCSSQMSINLAIFEKYKEYVSESVDTSKLEIDVDETPSYQNVTADVTVETRDSMFGRRYCDLLFKCYEDENLTKKIHLHESRLHGRFRITSFRGEIDLNSLRYVDKFDIFMMRLDRAFCDITDIMEMYDDDVEVEAEPEASWN